MTKLNDLPESIHMIIGGGSRGAPGARVPPLIQLEVGAVLPPFQSYANVYHNSNSIRDLVSETTQNNIIYTVLLL